MIDIHFNKPFMTGKEAHYMYQAVYTGKLSGNGVFTKKCQEFFETKYGFKKCLMTTSCTDALEMAAILCDVQPGDEVIVPSYTFVSSALAFVRQGAKIVFADSYADNPNIDADQIEQLITDRTKVIVPVHYAGVACDMDKIMAIANRHNLLVVEDAAQAIDSYYNGNGNDNDNGQRASLAHTFRCENDNGQRALLAHTFRCENSNWRPLGGIGHFGCFSFHETKNVTAGGEGGLLVVNDERFIRRAEIIWEKGTNRAEFFRGMVNKYGWVDTGSSFLPSEINSAFLLAQLEQLDDIQKRRRTLWDRYYEGLRNLADEGFIEIPQCPDYATNNAHMFYFVCRNLDERTRLLDTLKGRGILAVFHYLSLHLSDYNKAHNDYIPDLPHCDRFADCLVRLPMFYELTLEQVDKIVSIIQRFFKE